MSGTLSVRRWMAFAQGGGCLWIALWAYAPVLYQLHVYTCTWKKADSVFHCERKHFML